jgi:hypothetical protein
VLNLADNAAALHVGARAICQVIRSCPKLQVLALSLCKLGEKGGIAIVDAISDANLQSLQFVAALLVSLLVYSSSVLFLGLPHPTSHRLASHRLASHRLASSHTASRPRVASACTASPRTIRVRLASARTCLLFAAFAFLDWAQSSGRLAVDRRTCHGFGESLAPKPTRTRVLCNLPDDYTPHGIWWHAWYLVACTPHGIWWHAWYLVACHAQRGNACGCLSRVML